MPPLSQTAAIAKPGRAAAAVVEPNGKATEDLAEACGALEGELEELKAKYEMYFLGVERLEPARWRGDLKKKVERLKGAFTRNAALRFRLQALHARYLSYERLWVRAAREKEEGTYRRDLFKAKLRGRIEEPNEASAAKTPVPAPGATGPLAASAASAAEGTGTPLPKPARTPVPTSTPVPGVGEAELRALYTEYVAAKRRCNEDTSRVTYDALARSIAKQVPDLLARHRARSLEFKVVVKDGRAILKALPRS